jgi:hypothetical protein
MRLACLLALCTFVHATASDIRAAKLPERASHVKLSDGGDRYSTDSVDPTDKEPDYPTGRDGAASVTELVSPQNIDEQDPSVPTSLRPF